MEKTVRQETIGSSRRLCLVRNEAVRPRIRQNQVDFGTKPAGGLSGF
jgi:hypothetical protein